MKKRTIRFYRNNHYMGWKKFVSPKENFLEIQSWVRSDENHSVLIGNCIIDSTNLYKLLPDHESAVKLYEAMYQILG